MKTVSLSALLATSLLALACGSDDGGAERPGLDDLAMGQGGGTGNQMPMGQAGGAAMPGGEETVGPDPAAMMMMPQAPEYTYGPALTISADTVTEATTGISGNVFDASNMPVDPEGPPASEIAALTATDDMLCWNGNIYPVPDMDSYGTHWGVQVGINLNVAPDPAGG